MKRSLLGIILGCLVCLTGCMTHVNLTIKNPTPSDLVVDIIPKDEHSFSKGDINVGTVSKLSGTATQSFQVPKKGGCQVTAALPASAQVFDQSFSVLGQADPVAKTVTLSMTDKFVPTNGDGLKALFSKLGDDRGFAPHDLGNALNTIIGGIIVFVPPSGQQAEPEIRFQLTPAQFSSVMDLNGFPFLGTDDSADEDVKKDDTLDLSASVPIYGSLSGHFAAGSIYKVHSELKGYGPVNKPETPGWNLEDALEKLSVPQKKSICAAMKDGKATLLYINEVYALQLANFNYQQGNTLAVGAKMDGGSVISGNTAYTFSSSEIKSFSVQSAALNFNGIKKTYDDLPCTAWANPVTAERVRNLGNAGQPVDGVRGTESTTSNESHVAKSNTAGTLPDSVAGKLNLKGASVKLQ